MVTEKHNIPSNHNMSSNHNLRIQQTACFASEQPSLLITEWLIIVLCSNINNKQKIKLTMMRTKFNIPTMASSWQWGSQYAKQSQWISITNTTNSNKQQLLQANNHVISENKATDLMFFTWVTTITYFYANNSTTRPDGWLITFYVSDVQQTIVTLSPRQLCACGLFYILD